MKGLLLGAALLLLIGLGCRKGPENPYPGKEPYVGPASPPPPAIQP